MAIQPKRMRAGDAADFVAKMNAGRPGARSAVLSAGHRGGDTAFVPEPGRRYRSARLPSGRFAKILVPNVGEFLRLRESALVEAAPQNGAPKMVEFSFALARRALKMLLAGITGAPVPVIYAQGFDPVATEAELQAAAAQRPDAERAVYADEKMVEDGLAVACSTALDVQAMSKVALYLRVTGEMWDSPSTHLGSMESAEMHTDAADDCLALDAAITKMMQEVRVASAAPKAGTTGPMRSLQVFDE